MKKKHEQLMDWVRIHGMVSSVEVRQWGLDNGYIRADRTMRDFAELGQKVRRLTDYEIDTFRLRQPGATRIAWWAAV